MTSRVSNLCNLRSGLLTYVLQSKTGKYQNKIKKLKLIFVPYFFYYKKIKKKALTKGYTNEIATTLNWGQSTFFLFLIFYVSKMLIQKVRRHGELLFLDRKHCFSVCTMVHMCLQVAHLIFCIRCFINFIFSYLTMRMWW